MLKIDIRKILKRAQRGKYAIPHFNTSDLEITQAIIDAAKKMKSPVIIAVSEKAIKYAGLKTLSLIVRNEARKAVGIPVILHLDHGKSIEIVQECLSAGYDSIMIDGSDLSFEDNINLTRKAAMLAHRNKAALEGELGILKTEDKVFLTDPRKAKEFVQKTGVDSLAVAIGNAHGIPKKDEKLDFARLEKISKLVKVPLVLHGASSTSARDIKKAISLGICKINIDTDIRLAFTNNLRNFMKAHPDVYDPRDILSSAKVAVEKVAKEKIKLFGSNGKI